jgi:predicted nucleic acid-binding protein
MPIAAVDAAMRTLIDTNVLVYADSADERVKQRKAIAAIKALRAQGHAVLSTQVLNEYVNVALRRLKLPAPLLRERLAFYGGFDIVPVTVELIEGALNQHVLHGTSYFDALILQAAIVSGCEQLLTEDMSTGAVFGGVRIVDPFSKA